MSESTSLLSLPGPQARSPQEPNKEKKNELPPRASNHVPSDRPMGSTASGPEKAPSLPRYGISWQGPQSPISVPMRDGYWTPWHLAHELLAAETLGQSLCLMNLRAWVDEGMAIHRREYGNAMPPGLAGVIAAQVWLHVGEALKRETSVVCKCGCSRSAHTFYRAGGIFTACKVCACEAYEPATNINAVDPCDGIVEGQPPREKESS